jgi:hypothetical protein
LVGGSEEGLVSENENKKKKSRVREGSKKRPFML